MGKPAAKLYTFFLLFFLIGITAFSIFKYTSGLKEKYGLLDNLNKTKEELGVLNIQKQNLLQTIEKAKKLQQELSQKNLALTDSLKLNEEELANLRTDSSQLNSKIEELDSQNTLLKTENTALRENADKLKAQINQVSHENDELKARFDSIVELKKAIIELRRGPRNVSRNINKPNMMAISEGNQGFIIKEGSSTYPLKVKIEVSPIQVGNQ